ncbi:MAG TPA: ATPase, T2SS/T4P/T4SS family, partial [Bacillota bacterium]|nr:ATPase, T2SS/T4P/T4SS family [Bacillota bacterium]
MTQPSTGRPTPGPEIPGASRQRLADFPFFAGGVDAASPATPTAPRQPVGRRAAATSAPAAWRDGVTVDWPQVRALTRRVSEEIQTQHGQRAASLTGIDRQMMAEPIIAKVVADHAERQTRDGNLWSQHDVRAHVKAITDSVFGLGRLQPLFEIPTAENVNINGHDSVVVVHQDGSREELPPVADSNDELIDQLRHIGQNSSPKRPLDAAHPEMTVMVDGKFRLHAILNETSPVPSVSIRQHHLVAVSLADLAARGLMPMPVAEFLDAMVKANRTIVVGGEIGAGKTTLLRALLDAIPLNERYATLETDLELFAHRQPGRGNNLVLHARSGMGETTQDGDQIGQISVADQIPWALRQDV